MRVLILPNYHTLMPVHPPKSSLLRRSCSPYFDDVSGTLLKSLPSLVRPRAVLNPNSSPLHSLAGLAPVGKGALVNLGTSREVLGLGGDLLDAPVRQIRGEVSGALEQRVHVGD